MATLTYESKTRRGWRLRVYAVGDSTRRYSIWLGDVPEREARVTRRHVEAITESQKLGTPMPGETVRWLRSIDDPLRRKLDPLLGAARTVASAVDAYLAWSAGTHKPSTVRAAEQTLLAFRGDFGREQMRSLTAERLDHWIGQHNVAANTTAKHAKSLKAFITWSRARGWVDALQLRSSSTIAAGAKHFVDLAKIEQLMRALPCPQDRCALALARWSGLRVPSELAIRRAHINWETLRLTIIDSKRTKRNSRDPPVERQTPVFQELVPYLEAVWDLSRAPSDYLLPAVVASAAAFDGRIRAARERLGLDWPRLFHSLRATRETELIAQFGDLAACRWIGNSPSTAKGFYELVTDATWEEATGSRGLS